MSRFFYRSRNPVLETLGQLAMLASVIAAIVYPFNILPFNPIYVKGSAVAFLALYTLFRISAFDHFILFVALIAGAIGDIQISMPVPNAMANAMQSFMVEHVLLILLFLRNRMSAYDISSARVRGAAVIWAMTGVALFLLWQDLGSDRNMVLIYMGALIGMATAGLFSRFSIKMVGIGAIFFVVSDSMIAAQTFMGAPEWLSIFVWILYYLSQLLITAGVLLAPNRDKPLPMR